MISVSVVIPVYGSEAILPKLVQKIHKVMVENDYDYELILVCDASPDNSWSSIKELKLQYPKIKGILLRQNSGQHNAVFSGLAASSYPIIVTLDDDLQHDPEDIPSLMKALEPGVDVVYGVFTNRNHPMWKKIGSRFNNNVANLILSKPKDLYLSPFRLIRRELVTEILKFKGPFVYIDGLILALTRQIQSVEVAHHLRNSGRSNYGISKSIKLWLEMISTTSIKPIRIMTLFGATLSFLSLIAGILLVIQRLTSDTFPSGWASIIVTILLFSGVQLLSLGVIGEYLGKTALAVTGLPQTVEKEQI
jgi:undecaprenyl-phosphate 4-deoxy-4-formamido-L-arabinose transferase